MVDAKKTNALQKFFAIAELAAVVGPGQLPVRGEVVSKIWAHIKKKNNLQDPKNKRDILADAKLKPVFGGSGQQVGHAASL